jgi:hypothetical protein
MIRRDTSLSYPSRLDSGADSPDSSLQALPITGWCLRSSTRICLVMDSGAPAAKRD